MLCVKKGNNYINLPGHLKREGFFFFSFGAYCLYILLEIQKVTGGIKLHLLLIVHMCKWHDRNCTSQKLKILMLNVVWKLSSGFFLLVINSITSNLCLLPGINVKKGRGRYIDTCMVTFAPRYLLDNKSSYKLAFVQREFARGQVRAFLPFPPGVRHSVL